MVNARAILHSIQFRHFGMCLGKRWLKRFPRRICAAKQHFPLQIRAIHRRLLRKCWFNQRFLRKRSDSIRRQNLKDICEIFIVATASQAEILDAIEKDSFADLEDCLQDKCAKDVGADYIITCNVRDFENSEIPAITPEDFLKKCWTQVFWTGRCTGV